jgi:hypothetical protein
MAGVAFVYLGAHLVWEVREWMPAFDGRRDMFFNLVPMLCGGACSFIVDESFV